MKLIITTLFFSFCFCLFSYGQIKIGDNPQTIDASSVLELESTSHVLVITRVTTTQMEAITPSPGGMVYNIDEECIHYYTGTTWINLCEAGGISNLTTDPLVNDFRTITITPQGDMNHIEVGIIRGEQIADNSIDTSKLGENSVTANELSDNSVGTNELLDNSIEPVDIANTNPNQVLTTDTNGIVVWANATSLTNVNTDGTTITGNGSVANPLEVSATILDAIQTNTTANTNDTDGDESNEIQQLSINPAGTIISLTDGGSITLPAGTVNTDNQSLSRTGNIINITGGTGVDLSPILTSGADGVINNVELDNTNLNFTGIAGGFNGSIDLSGLGGGSNPEFEATKISGNGVTADPYTIAINAITTTEIANNTIRSADILNETIALEDIGQNGAADGQIIKWDGVGNTWIIGNDRTDGTGIPSLTNGTILIGDNANQPQERVIGGDATMNINGVLTIEDDAVTSAKIVNATITLEDLSTMGATTTGEILKWNNLTTSWELGTDETGTSITDAEVNDGLSDFSPTTGYNINVDDTTIEIVTDNLQVKDESITSAKIANATIALEDLSTMGATTTGEILKWNNLTTSWELGTDETGTSITDAEVNDGLSDFSPTTGYNINVDDTTIEIVTDNLQVKDESITSAKIANATITLEDLSTMGATTTGEILKWNNLTTSWELGTDETGTSITDAEVNDGLSDFSPTTGYNINVDDTTIEIVTDNLQVKDNGITTAKIDEGEDGQVLTTNGTDVAWANPQNIENSDLTLPNDRILALNGNNLNFSGGGNIGVGIVPIEKLHVDGNIRAEGNIQATGDITTDGDLVDNTPDYVFQKYFNGTSKLKKEYQFKSLNEVEQFITKNHHLPGIKSAEEIKKQGFWNLGESTRINLEKIEELFLHTIEQEKKIKDLQEEKNNLSEELNALKKDIKLIKEALLKK
ncbi:hypothetical protein [uncultured Maribacter sp.]|uniref:beta strand repeat-containing protein n=1 Tax=uncultured Maribacter sp. TaxID=431308 RepID=UPI0026329FB2|nr:hypothetical protein [uncultured Maribacter sp.]